MAFNLSEQKIRQRLIEWRNLKHLHAEQKRRNQKLERELRELKIRYEQDIAQRDQLIEKLMLRMGDLEKMVFGDKQNRGNGSANNQSSSGNRKKKKRHPKHSYQRSVPANAEVTKEKHHSRHRLQALRRLSITL